MSAGSNLCRTSVLSDTSGPQWSKKLDLRERKKGASGGAGWRPASAAGPPLARRAFARQQASSWFPGTEMKEPLLRSSPPGESQELSVRHKKGVLATVLGLHATARPSVERRRARPA